MVDERRLVGAAEPTASSVTRRRCCRCRTRANGVPHCVARRRRGRAAVVFVSVQFVSKEAENALLCGLCLLIYDDHIVF